MGEHRRQLLQNFEDAKLALLLDEYAEVYGKISTERYERDLAAGKIESISEQDLEEQLNRILRRAEAEESQPIRSGKHFSSIARKAANVAATIAFFFLLMITVQAAGIDIFGAIGRWTDSLFHFDSETQVESEQKHDVVEFALTPVEELKKELLLNDFPTELVPFWLPDDYSISKISYPENNKIKSAIFYLQNTTGQWISYQIDLFPDLCSSADEWIEKDSSDVESLFLNRRQYYLFQNNSVWTGVFQSEKYRISVLDGSKDELIEILQSIGGLNND